MAQKILIVDKEELQEKLLYTSDLITDQVCNLMYDLEKMYRKFGFPPAEDSGDEEIDKYAEKTKWMLILDKHENIIRRHIYKYLLKGGEKNK